MSKPMETETDLSRAFIPGVAAPCLEIVKDPSLVYKYTVKGNMVAVVSNGTSVLGLGNIGPEASKPVMEGKAVLFKKFAGVEAVDICIDAKKPEDVVNCVKCLGPSFGGINLEDIKGPDCFYIERELKKKMNIPVFHDDQHGTAVIVLAGLINALDIKKKELDKIKIVVLGAGAAGIASLKLMIRGGAKRENCILCDSKGVIYKGRKAGMNPFKEELAADTDLRTFEEAVVGADCIFGLSKPGLFTEKILKSLNKDPIIFAMANPEPECRPELAKKIRPDCIIATGRSDYPNQINNVMCFPFLFRAALDTRSSEINEEMKMAASVALAELARRPATLRVRKAYLGRDFVYGPEYIIPTPFDIRLMDTVPIAVAKAAMETGAATKQITDWDEYREYLCHRLFYE